MPTRKKQTGAKRKSSRHGQAKLPIQSFHEQMLRERERRIAAHKRVVASWKRARARLALTGGGKPLNMLADGDSWFDYPLANDVIKSIQANAKLTPEVLNLACHGDASSVTMGVSKRETLIQSLKDPDNGAFDALLFSSGGDDIVGDQFCLLVDQYTAGAPPASGIDAARLADALGLIEAAYLDLFEVRNQLQPNCVIFVHAYDFARPTGKGVCTYGPWLKPSLDYRGWTNYLQASDVVKAMLTSFGNLMLKLAASGPAMGKVVYVQTQGTLTPPPPPPALSADWANELHPTPDGFDKIGAKFLQALGQRFPGRI